MNDLTVHDRLVVVALPISARRPTMFVYRYIYYLKYLGTELLTVLFSGSLK